MEAGDGRSAARQGGDGPGLRSVPAARKALPRGPHALPQEIVLEHQRERLLGAAAEALAENGFCELTVRDVIVGAHVSRRTFYELFDGKLECVLAAHAMALGRFERLVRAACKAQRSWEDGVAAAVSAGLEFAERSPAEARLILLASHTVSEPNMIEAAREAHDKIAELLRAGRPRVSDGEELPELTESALVGAITAIVGERLCEGEVKGLRRLAPQLVQLILAPYVGRSEARRLAPAA
jgi:AcrR family transcriptional regulator